MRTGLRVDADELVLALDRDRNLWTSWWNTRTQDYDRRLELDEQTRRAEKGGGTAGRFQVREVVTPDGRLLTYGYALTRVGVATIVQDGAPRVSTALRPYPGDQEVTLFWVSRRGVPMSKDVPDGKRAVCTLYRQDGTVIDQPTLKEDTARPQEG
ncbi:hypothetical protein [Micromonospora sp. WMMD980]|uniref:hypothetical protein n=1 Tax=Micromonospora sp. WMMD980 TaxID=3016088 RepID=UPI00241712B2|nr:hypothetical protein [Micromonospora sp. WMMD980]MDG4801941.1 hypothetical protein [Micromonospora sp. WMMD980]